VAQPASGEDRNTIAQVWANEPDYHNWGETSRVPKNKTGRSIWNGPFALCLKKLSRRRRAPRQLLQVSILFPNLCHRLFH